MRTPPISAIPHQGVEDGEQLPHARHQSNLLGFAGRKQPLVKLLDGGIVAGGDQGAHVEGRPHRSPSSPHLSLTTSLPGVPVEGSHSHEGAQTLVGELSQLGQLGQKSASQDRTDSGNALEQCLILLESGAGVDGPVEVGVGAGELLFEPLDMCPDSLLECRRGDLKAVVLGDEHRENLASSGEKSLQKLGFLIGNDAWRRLHGASEAGQDEGVDLVGLGEPADSLGEILSLAGVYDRHRDSGGDDGGGRKTLVATGGFQDDQFGACSLETAEEFIDALLIVGDREGLRVECLRGFARQEAYVEGPLGDVDADVKLASGTGIAQVVSPLSSSSFCRPGLIDSGLLVSVARALAPATVRAPPNSGHDDECFTAVLARPLERSNRSVAPTLLAAL